MGVPSWCGLGQAACPRLFVNGQPHAVPQVMRQRRPQVLAIMSVHGLKEVPAPHARLGVRERGGSGRGGDDQGVGRLYEVGRALLGIVWSVLVVRAFIVVRILLGGLDCVIPAGGCGCLYGLVCG